MGVCLESSLDKDAIFAPAFGDIVAEVKADTFEELVGEYTLIGEVTNEKAFAYGDVKIGMDDALDAWTKPLEKVFATKSAESSDIPVEEKLYDASTVHVCSHKIGQPTVFIPVFPGTNCEYDSARAFERAGANVITKVFRNLDAEDIRSSVEEFEKRFLKRRLLCSPVDLVREMNLMDRQSSLQQRLETQRLKKR